MASDDRQRRTPDPLVEREASSAAAQAARIGGTVPPVNEDAALHPVYEAGGGEQEGFEEAESELVEAASHGGSRGSPVRHQFPPERESDRATAVDGEADESAVPDS